MATNRKLRLNRPLAILDLETTGTAIGIDRIVEIAILKVNPDGKKTKLSERINPEMPIPCEVTAIHGIADKDVSKSPTFAKLANEIATFLNGCDLAGYNFIKFDLPILQTEFARVKVDFALDGRHLVDACTIFHKHERRDLAAAMKFVCDEDHEGAHSALADVGASLKVLEAQLNRYPNLPSEMKGLHDFCNEKDGRFVDADRKFEWRQNEASFAFGQKRGLSLREVAKDDPRFLQWMLQKDFSPETKQIVSSALQGKFPKREQAP